MTGSNFWWSKCLLLGLVVFSFKTLHAQKTETELREEIVVFQAEQDAHYRGKTSPLPRKERKKFTGHHFYPVDLNYVVEAFFERIESEDTIEMVTSSGTTKYYRPYARLHFEIDGQKCELITYQSFLLRETKEYSNYLFLPFKDGTSGSTSYGGGRYLDLIIPEGDSISLNFNLAYNPYCAYTSGYNCPIPPVENTLKPAIKAGLMAVEDHE